jgi:hypothetical protein
MKIVISLLILLLSQSLFALELKVEQNEIFKSLLKEFSERGGSPEIYGLSTQYRLDLSLQDLVDQTAEITHRRKNLHQELKSIYTANDHNFYAWYMALKDAAKKDEKLLKKLNRRLKFELYANNRTALLPKYKYISLKKLVQGRRLRRITEYNKIAADPEGTALLAIFKQKKLKHFYTKDLTTAKFNQLNDARIRKLRKSYFKKLTGLYNYEDKYCEYEYNAKRIKIKKCQKLIDNRGKQIFRILQKIPNKTQLMEYMSYHLQDIPKRNGLVVLGAGYIADHYSKVESLLKEFTLQQILHGDDDDYILSVRKFTKKNIDEIDAKLAEFNSENQTELTIQYKNREKLPKRVETILNLEILLELYPDAPWLKDNDKPVLISKRGNARFFHNKIHKRIGVFFRQLGKELIKPENYVSLLAGTAIMVITEGNLPLAMGTQKLVKDAIHTARYDKEWEEYFKQAPKTVVNTFLMTAGFGSGRFFKILALGATGGAIQSLTTGQDIKMGALVGAGLNIIQYYFLNSSIAKPMVNGLDPVALATNRKLEMLEKTIRGTVHGAAVAALTGENIAFGALKGGAFGSISTALIIWFVGTRYYPFLDFADADIDEMIELENEFQNLVGRGGEYNIDRQLIMDANFRVGGALPDWIWASITLPGNVSMYSRHADDLMTITHEAHHLMQQHQSGVFGFYLFRYLPTSLVSGYYGHPDENFLEDFIGYID